MCSDLYCYKAVYAHIAMMKYILKFYVNSADSVLCLSLSPRGRAVTRVLVTTCLNKKPVKRDINFFVEEWVKSILHLGV